MSRWKILAATTALAAMVVVSLPVSARDLQPLTTAAPEQVGMSPERLGRVSSVLKKEIADGKLPGAVVMVARKGKIVYSDAIGFQDKGANTPMKPNSLPRYSTGHLGRRLPIAKRRSGFSRYKMSPMAQASDKSGQRYPLWRGRRKSADAINRRD